MMLNETYRAMLGNKSVIRETFMYGKKRDRRDRLRECVRLLAGQPQRALPAGIYRRHAGPAGQRGTGESARLLPQPGDPGFRADVAAHLAKTFGLPYEQKHIFPTTGAAGAIAHAIRAVTQPGDEC